jgi:thioredoxin 1
MSEAFSPDSVTFAKFNTDEAGDLARQLGITAMPTFKLFKGGVEVDMMRGWAGEAQLAGLLRKHGAKDATKKAD